jgi:hypothetical protein
MTTKLTLSVEKRVVQKAKRFAQTQKKSLSEIVTNYLDYISSQAIDASEIDPEVLQVKSLLKRYLMLKKPDFGI